MKIQQIQRWVFTVFLFSILAIGHAQQPRVYTMEQGLQSSYVNKVYLDRSNFLWVSTNESLELFDGYRFHAIDCTDPKTGKRLFDKTQAVRQIDDTHFCILTNVGLFVFDRRDNSFRRVKVARNEPELGYSLTQILDYPKGNRYIIPSDGYGAFVIDKTTLKTDTVESERLNRLIASGFINEILVDSKGRLWTHTMGKNLRVFDLKRMKQVGVNMTPSARQILAENNVVCFLEDRAANKIWMATGHSGLLVWDGNRRILREVADNHKGLFSMSLLLTKNGTLLVGTDNQGLWRLDRKTEQLSRVDFPQADYDLTFAKIHTLAQDANGNVLAGLYQRGLLLIPSSTEGFQCLPMSLLENGKNTSCVSSILPGDGNTTWVGTDGSGVFHLQKGMKPQPVNTGLNSLLVQTLATDRRGTLWAGAWHGGLQCLQNGGFETPDFLKPYASVSVMSLSYDADNDCLYAGTNGRGLLCVDLKHRKVTQLVSNGSTAWINSVRLDSDRQIWFSDALSNYCYDLRAQKLYTVRLDNASQVQLASCFAQDGNKILVGTDHGLYAVDRNTRQQVSLPCLKGLDDVSVKSIVVSSPYIWVATRSKLLCIDKQTSRITSFRSFGGYAMGEFHGDGGARLADGTLAFGADNGVVSFRPKTLLDASGKGGSVRFTSMWVGNANVEYVKNEDLDNVLDASILLARIARFHRGDNSFRISFCVPEMGQPGRITYTYILDGYEKTWHTTDGSNPEAYYASLPTGNYTLRVRAHYLNSVGPAGESGSYAESSIRIVVPAPLYATWWAFMLYGLVFCVIAYIVYQNIRERQQAKAQLRDSKHNEQIKEAKLRLFTSIAHELRSPLTMIVSPLRVLLETEKDADRLSNYHIMERNCNRLLRVVNQITDVRKIDNGQFRLHFSLVDILAYEDEVMRSFMGLAVAKNISFTSESEENQVQVWIDALHFEKVLTNLFSNAFKFTPNDGRIIVRTRCCMNVVDGKRQLDDDHILEYVEIKVYNSGSHIAEQDLGRIYERFYQSEDSSSTMGSGIGLNLAFELVKLHHGTIEVHNVATDGVEFVVCLPMGCAHLTPEELQPRKTSDASAMETVREADRVETSNVETPEEETDTEAENEPSTAAAPQRPAQDDATTSVPDSPTEPGETAPDTASETPSVRTEKDEVAETDPDGVAEQDDEKVSAQSGNLKPDYHVLVVDDDKELLEYVSRQLTDGYTVATATGGNQAWQQILATRPDVVVTDLMMPDGDGYTLCKRIKGNPETDHIAVIVLTSEAGVDNQVKLMDLQADHFLPKPFNILVMKSALQQVLRVRENLRAKMRRTEIGHNYAAVTLDNTEDVFIKRVHDAIMDHIEDSEFGVEDLSSVIGISRVHLNRKLKKLYGVSPSIYIRSIRLKQAAYLLVNNRVSVSEVVYAVGFSSHSYFSSSFHDYFGMSPKEFIAYYSDNLNEEALRKLLE